MNTTQQAFILAVLVPAILSGCDDQPRGPSDGARSSPSTPTSEPAGPEPFPVVTGSRAQGGGFAALNGSLALVDGCLVVSRGGESVVPVFLSGDEPTWDAESERLELAGEEYALGSAVEFGGGEADLGGLEVRSLPEACESRAIYFVVSSSG